MSGPESFALAAVETKINKAEATCAIDLIFSFMSQLYYTILTLGYPYMRQVRILNDVGRSGLKDEAPEFPHFPQEL